MKPFLPILIFLISSQCQVDINKASFQPAQHKYKPAERINLLSEGDDYFVELQFYDQKRNLRGFVEIDYLKDKVLLGLRFISVGGPGYQKIKIDFDKSKLPNNWQDKLFWYEYGFQESWKSGWVVLERKLHIRQESIKDLYTFSQGNKIGLISFNDDLSGAIVPVYPPDRKVLNEGTLYYEVQCKSASGERCCTDQELLNQINDIHQYYQKNSVKFSFLKKDVALSAPPNLINKHQNYPTELFAQDCRGKNEYSLLQWGICSTIIVRLNIGPGACKAQE